MACSDYNELWKFLGDFAGDAPMDAVICFFQGQMGIGLFAAMVFGGAGAALTIRTRSLAPLLVVTMLSSSIIFVAVPSPVVRIGALVLIIGIAVGGYVMYQRTSSAL